MKYTILINQAGIVDAGLQNKTDVVDWSLLDYIFSFQQNPKATFNTEGKVWINLKHLIEEMPLLGLNRKNSVSDRIKKVRELGLLTTSQSPVDQRLYVRTTELFYEITQFKGEPRQHKENEAVRRDEQTVRRDEQTVRQDVHSYNHQDTTIKSNNQDNKNNSESNTHAHEAEPKSPLTANLPLGNENTGFNPPTVEDVMTYCTSMCLKMPLDEAESFIDHYESVGWMSGNTRIKDWRGKARSWSKRKQTESKTISPKKPFTKAGSKDFGNLPEYTLPEKYRSEPNYSEGAIDSTATPVFNGLIGSDE